MSAAVLQGVPVVTHDVDLWIDLPSRQYMTPVNLALRQGATMIRNTVVELSNGFLTRKEGGKDFGIPFLKVKIANRKSEIANPKSQIEVGCPTWI